MEGHIVSIVPSRDYYQRHGLSSGDRFAPVGSDFDGIVFYTSLNCIDIVRLEKYSRGMLVETAEVNLSADDPKDRYGKLYSLAGQFGVSRRARMQSRSSENGNTSYTIYHGTNLSGIQSYRGSCIAQGMASVNAVFGGPAYRNEEYFIDCYENYSSYRHDIALNIRNPYINADGELCYGMINSGVSDYIKMFFTTAPYTGLYNAISAGNYVLTNVSTAGGGHDIIICGYSTSNDIIYYDTGDGTYKTMSAFGIKGDYYVEVTGVK